MKAVVAALALSACAHKPPPPSPKPPAGEPAPAPPAAARVETPDLWRAEGKAFLAQAQQALPTTRARNLILFVGDGMGLSTVTAARILQGQTADPKTPGEEGLLAFETFPATALAKTYNTDLQTAESAGAMSAIMTGVKTRGSSVAMDQAPPRGQCAGSFDHRTKTLLETAKDAGMSAGLVTTARVTHGAPAATYTHVTDRDWETDARMSAEARSQGCLDIARQFVTPEGRTPLDLLLGGGRLAFMPSSDSDPGEKDRYGARADGRDLIETWKTARGRYVWTENQLKGVDWSAGGPVLGLFAPDHMAFEADRTDRGRDQPSLTTMTQAAIQGLGRNPKGYVLVVVAGGIDRAHHAGNARRALLDTIELSNAVAKAVELTKEKGDTLIVVTAEHSHTLTIGGYPERGNPILGLAFGDGRQQLDNEGQPYTTLAYANGPGAQPPIEGALVEAVAEGENYRQAAAVPMTAETHGGEDVPIYAAGPGSQWVRGVMEQSSLYWILQAALAELQPPAPPPKPEPKKSIFKLPKLKLF